MTQRHDTLNTNINATLVFAFIFDELNSKDFKHFLITQKTCFSEIMFTNLFKSVSEHFSSDKIIHPTSQA